MILNRQHFDIDNRCIIEKVIVKTPMRYTRIFPNEACFLHFKSGQLMLSSATGKTKITASESVLLNCGNHFADLVHPSSGETMEVVAVHLYPDLLKEIYHTEIPPSLKPNYIKSHSTRIKNTLFITQFVQGLNIYFENPRKNKMPQSIFTVKNSMKAVRRISTFLGISMFMFGSPNEFIMISRWNTEKDLENFAGLSWNQAHIPKGMEKYISECSVSHYYTIEIPF